jgi:hypothetical protein
MGVVQDRARLLRAARPRSNEPQAWPPAGDGRVGPTKRAPAEAGAYNPQGGTAEKGDENG